MTDHLDQVLGPTDDTVSFIQARGMFYVTALWVLAAAWLPLLLIAIAVRMATGYRPSASDIVVFFEATLVVPAVVAAVLMLVVWRRLGWLHTSVHGIDFAATSRQPVHLPWSGIAAVALHGRGPFTELVISPISENYATRLPGKGGPPRVRRRGGEFAYVIDVGLMSPGPEVLLAELHRRLPSKV
ncbi:hypothetical protein GCM10010112_29440 [Actinoplanes lobatus]|uniref:PH domain-containing protein n=1 Tax=Actinoplanes lobatus TaxID=113568 RepID=A0A7W7MLL5_9ACTN|nr:hypothetical protein [Actinoplanes lobatus]MBB4754653.1 hypothetical protein [Actinoplanes lobatus]GGN66728.1 hypothetical protein GCM10010112_29440 [Actinoplanes lobatus]GIE42494.1 hypothetical protein Alo02nite_53920 [Actinoplanes lobatus]